MFSENQKIIAIFIFGRYRFTVLSLISSSAGFLYSFTCIAIDLTIVAKQRRNNQWKFSKLQTRAKLACMAL